MQHTWLGGTTQQQQPRSVLAPKTAALPRHSIACSKQEQQSRQQQPRQQQPGSAPKVLHANHGGSHRHPLIHRSGQPGVHAAQADPSHADAGSVHIRPAHKGNMRRGAADRRADRPGGRGNPGSSQAAHRAVVSDQPRAAKQTQAGRTSQHACAASAPVLQVVQQALYVPDVVQQEGALTAAPPRPAEVPDRQCKSVGGGVGWHGGPKGEVSARAQQCTGTAGQHHASNGSSRSGRGVRQRAGGPPDKCLLIALPGTHACHAASAVIPAAAGAHAAAGHFSSGIGSWHE